MLSKRMLFNFCKTFVEERMNRIQKNIFDIQESLASEIKSSAGDKHETGRAMLQLEREKLGQQLAEAEKMAQVMSKVPLKDTVGVIGLGNIVRTGQGDYYLAVSAGECSGDGDRVFCISIGTPIGLMLRGKSVGDSFEFNDRKITILEIE